jgi:hypothetical protein
MEGITEQSVTQVDYGSVANRCLSSEITKLCDSDEKLSNDHLITNLGGGALVGAAVGSVVPVVGTIIGGLAGAVVGFVKADKEAKNTYGTTTLGFRDDHCAILRKLVKEEIIKLAGKYGLTDLEFENLIEKSVNSKLGGKEWIKKMLDLKTDDGAETKLRGQIRESFEKEFQGTLRSRPRG